MNGFYRRLLPSLIILILFFMTQNIEKVAACTMSPPPTLEESLASAGTIVRGRLIESDIARQNYILQVESYLVGEPGPEFLLLSKNLPMYIQGIIDNMLGNGDCNFIKSPLPLHTVIYVTLGTPGADGVYHINSYNSVTIWENHFPLELNYPEGASLGIYDQLEFEQYLQDMHGSTPTAPLPDSRYPSTAPLLVITENGDEYVLPVSATELVAVDAELLQQYFPTWIGVDYQDNTCKSWDCVTLTGDGRTLIIELENEFAYVQAHNVLRFQADSFLVSPTNLAIWKDDSITIFALHDGFGFLPQADLPRQIAQVTIETNALANADNSAWSSDGHLLAFSDERGLWLWDVFTPDTAPILLLPTDTDTPIALQFSGRGRYLTIAQGDERSTLDLQTDNTSFFGYISPDDMLKVICSPQPDIEEGSCYLRLLQINSPATFSGWLVQVDQDMRVEWINDSRVLIQVCKQPDNECGIIDSNAYEYDFYAEGWGNFYNISMYPSFKSALDFVVQGRNVALLIDSTTIEVNGTTLTFDLENPIVELRWLPSVFYGENPYQPQVVN